MRLVLPLLISISMAFQVFSQEQETVHFTEAIKPHLKSYNVQSDIEYERGDFVKGQMLFDSLVQNYLVGSRFDDYSFKSVNGRKVKLAKIDKPVFIITYASWCIINKGEIPALNKLSTKYADQVKFIVLFWDKKENVKDLARKFNNNISVCYANEAYKNDSRIVSAMKHTLGFPTTYFLNTNLDVVDIKRGGIQTPPRTPYREAISLNYNLFNDRISEWLQRKDDVKEQLADTD